MSIGNGGSVCHDYIAKRAFNRFLSFVRSLDLPVSRRYNALHGEKEIAAMLSHMCAHKCTPHAASMAMKIEAEDPASVATSQWFLGMLSAVSDRKMVLRCKKMQGAMAREYVRGGLIDRRSLVAIDSHLVPFTGDREAAGGNIVSGKPKGGTSKFTEFVTAQAVSEKHMPTVAVERRTGKNDMDSCLFGLLSAVGSAGMKPRAYLMDKGFYNVRSMEALDREGVRFMMPAVKNASTLGALDEVKRGERGAVSRHTVGPSGGEFTGWLVIKKRLVTKDGERKYEYLAFITNVPPRLIDEIFDDVPETYKKRWRIENGYKSIEQIRPATYSCNHAIRLLMFHVAVMACNMWYAANAAAREQALLDGMPRRRALKIHTFLSKFIGMIAGVAAAVISMSVPEAKLYLSGG